MSESLPVYVIAGAVAVMEILVVGGMIRRKMKGKPAGSKDRPL